MSIDPYDVLRRPRVATPLVAADPYDVLRAVPPPPPGFTLVSAPAPVAPDPYDVLRAAPTSAATADPYDVLRKPAASAAPTLQDQARQAQQEALSLPGDIASAVRRWVAGSDVGRIVGTYGPPVAGALGAVRQAIEPAVHTVANLPGIAQIGQAARAVGKAAGFGHRYNGCRRILPPILA